MKRRAGMRGGDTLIEVMFAIGIFSLVAVSVVGVMNKGTSSVQTALESTMARNEIDAQAEALRFIQTAYIAEKDGSSSSRYEELWTEIKKLAVKNRNATTSLTDFAPTTCAELYDDSSNKGIYKQNAFIINTRKLGTEAANSSSVLVSAQGSRTKFKAATLYPRLLFNGITETNLLDNALDAATLASAEGLYIVGMPGASQVVSVDDAGNTQVDSDMSYYDFYIRSCWYGTGASTPTTLSTVVRLYDPDATSVSYGMSQFNLYYKLDDSDSSPYDVSKAETTALKYSFELTDKQPTYNGKNLLGWTPDADGSCGSKVMIYDASSKTYVEVKMQEDGTLEGVAEKTVYGVWQCNYKLNYRSGFGDNGILTTTASGWLNQASYKFSNVGYNITKPTRTGYTFLKWSDSSNASPDVAATSSVTATVKEPEKSVYAVWRENYKIYYSVSEGSYDGVTVEECSSEVLPKDCVMTNTAKPTRTGYKFNGWKDASGNVYASGGVIRLSGNITLYPNWTEKNDTITVQLHFSSGDCDSHVTGNKSDGSSFHAYYSSKVGSDVGGLVLAQLDYDYTSGGVETFTLNTSGGKKYTYYVRNFSSCYLGSSSVYVTVHSKNGDFADQTFYSKGGSKDWYVFDYDDGRLIPRD